MCVCTNLACIEIYNKFFLYVAPPRSFQLRYRLQKAHGMLPLVGLPTDVDQGFASDHISCDLRRSHWAEEL